MADEAQVKELEESCSAIMELAPGKGNFIRRSKWGEIDFGVIENDIETVFWIVEQIKNLPTHILPDHVVQNTITHLTNVKNIFDRINEFKISQGDPSSSRDGIASELRGYVQSIVSEIGIWLPLLALHAGEIENWASKIKDVRTQVDRLLQETESHITTRKQQIDESAQAARVAAGKAGAAEFTEEFRKEAEARSWTHYI